MNVQLQFKYLCNKIFLVNLFQQIAIFTAAVYRCFSAFSKFIELEKTKSSTQMLTDIIDEWEQIFAKDVNMVLLKSFLKIVQHPEMNRNGMQKYKFFLDEISEAIDYIDLKHIERVCNFEHLLSWM